MIEMCGRDGCSVSTGICGSITAGIGGPDHNGYFKEPCNACVQYFTQVLESDQQQEEPDKFKYDKLPTLEQIEGWKLQLESPHRHSGSESKKNVLRSELTPYLLDCIQYLLNEREHAWGNY